MKKLFFFIVLLSAAMVLHAQTTTDSLAYQLQRKKINAMLEVRRQKFGQYDQSLSQHTGIFGLQTKKDIRRSNDILMEIVSTDNEIFQQLKILLDYRTFQQTQVQDNSKAIQESKLSYMTTINKLRDQLEKVTKDAEAADKAHDKVNIIFYVVIALMFLSILFLISKKRAVKS